MTVVDTLKRAARPVLRAALALVPDAVRVRILPPAERFDRTQPTAAISAPDTPIRMLVAPTNTAWQGWTLARGAEHVPGVGARTSNIVAEGGGYGFLADQVVSRAEYRWSSRWQRAQRRAVMTGFTHVLLEAARPIFGDALGRSVEADLVALRRAGLSVALMLYGSEIRSPQRHRERMPDSPFAAGLWSLTPALEELTARNKALADAFDGPKFLATPDLQLDLPEGVWLPITIDTSLWNPTRAPFTKLDGPPIVSHVPSSAVVKGTDLIEPILGRLHDEGLIRYTPLRGLQA
ncbi:MAG: hypothetical protein RL499_1183, partial [Actinomycetota bacterium]